MDPREALRNTWLRVGNRAAPTCGEHAMLRFHEKASMKPALCSAILTIALLAPAGFVAAQVSGTTTLGITEIELKDVISGVSAKRHVLGKDVYSDKNEVVGRAEDLILSRDRAVSYVVLGVGGFLGIGEHDVIIPVNQIKLTGDKMILTGATKDSIRAMPRFEYSRK